MAQERKAKDVEQAQNKGKCGGDAGKIHFLYTNKSKSICLRLFWIQASNSRLYLTLTKDIGEERVKFM